MTPALAAILLRKRWEPTQLGAGLAAWWSAQDYALMTDDGAGLISSWKDRVTGLAVTATTTARPTWGSRTLGESTAGANDGIAPGIRFDGVANFFVTTVLTALPTGSTPGELWAVCLPTTTGSASRVAGYGTSGASASRAIWKSGTDKAEVTDGTVGNQSAASVALGVGHIVGGNFSGTSMNGFLDGVAGTSNPSVISALNTPATRLRIGADVGTTPSVFYPGVVSDVMILSGVLSTSDRQKLEGYFAWQRGLASMLPNSHPYKNQAP